MALDLEVVPVRTFAVEALGDGEHFVLDVEQFVALHVRKFLAVAKRHHFALDFADLEAVDGVDSEVITAEREDFLLHLESGRLRTVECWVWRLRSKRRLEGSELCHFDTLGCASYCWFHLMGVSNRFTRKVAR